MTGREDEGQRKSVLSTERRAAQGDQQLKSGLTRSDSSGPDLPIAARRRRTAIPKSSPERHSQGHCRARRISRLFFSKLTRKTLSLPVAKSAVWGCGPLQSYDPVSPLYLSALRPA